ncbi:MAG: VTT domain-containing protein [Chitinophagaceae bacterium]|nr:VTT domain-containing protein [Chitinophagaceae bacterium]
MLDFIFLDFHWTQLLQPQWYIANGGLWLVLFVVFAETGLFAGFFLPGDSLLFVSGIYAHEITQADKTVEPGLAYQFLNLLGMGGVRNPMIDLFILMVLISIAGILGNSVGFWFGRKSGPALYNRKDTLLFKKKYLYQAKEFYDKNGGFAIIVARFVPFVRTFAPIVAGIVQMDRKKYFFYNVIGCVAWVITMVCAGYFLNKAFPILQQKLELIVIGIVLVSTLPIILKMIQSKREKRKNAGE